MRSAILALLACWPVVATIVDRIAITAGNQVITDSEVEQRIRLTAFENGDQPDFGPAVRKTAADRLIDQKLVEHEMEVGHYPRLTPDRAEALLAAYAKANYNSDLDALDRALEKFGLSRADLQTDLARQSDLLTFLSIRFRPAVQVTDLEVRRYFQTNIRPRLSNPDTGIEEFRSQIESEISSRQADLDLDAWLKDQRRRTKIQYLEKDLAP